MSRGKTIRVAKEWEDKIGIVHTPAVPKRVIRHIFSSFLLLLLLLFCRKVREEGRKGTCDTFD